MTKAMRLRRRQEFVAVQSSGRKVHGKLFLALVVETSGGAPVGRVGLTVTKRIGNAVIRNRIKRRAREWLRRHGWVPAGLTWCWSPRMRRGLDLADIGQDLARGGEDRLVLTRLVLAPVRFYRRYLSGKADPTCQYIPTCSTCVRPSGPQRFHRQAQGDGASRATAVPRWLPPGEWFDGARDATCAAPGKQ
jgi:hypothetical protein